ncbi:MAG: phenylalanine--tRNA ligase subunit beta [Synergistaceae bacterium]|jgi:phenylalanyl-tRNA synthetase beta chain|nr:phenylalanine--tRNA ligase subunit beta [Synergistaceae bacterium]
MRISLDWIKDYVELPSGLEVSRLARDLTMSTVEVEGASELRKRFSHIVIGEVLDVLPHPNADKLRICRTDIGGGETKEIVCGGINLTPRMRVAVAKPGAVVRWHGEGEPVEIKNARLRGVESYGMICASSEIGLFDLFPFEEEATIMDLSEFGAPNGTNLADALGLDDVILEIDNKSLTNRPDLWGHYGIARELAALYGLPMKPLPAFAPRDGAAGMNVAIEDPELCARYIGVKIEGVSPKPSPFKAQSRIWRVGMRPINSLVDITNYVMLAVGQPAHAFDSDNIEGHIAVRRARAGERLLLLNGRELSLTESDLVIADDEGPVGLAGVMGGAKDSVLDTTERVILEIANFEPIGLRRSAQRHELRTEASMRNEKGIDPQRADLALGLAMEMFRDEFPDMRVTGFDDNYPRELKRASIRVSLSWMARRMGTRIDDAEVRGMLERLGFGVRMDGDDMNVVVPSWRSTGDVSIPDDIMEEAARLRGYENFEPAAIVTSFEGAVNQRDADADRGIREYLSFRCGMQEVFTYPWVRGEFLSVTSDTTEGLLEISTPPSPNERFIRSSLLPNILKAVAENTRFFGEFAIYESGQVFYDADYSSPYDARESLPRGARSVAGAVVGRQSSASDLFRRAKGIVEWMPRYVHMAPFEFARGEKPVWADGAACLDVRLDHETVGKLALLSKKSALACGIKSSAVTLFELNIDSLKPHASRTNRYTRLPEYPRVEYDISMTFDETSEWEEIERTARGKKHPGGGDLVKSVSFVGVYRGKQVPDGKKSVTMRLVMGSDKKTLTSDEIEAAAGQIVKRLSKTLGGELRS